ncbi:prephenate dehydratase [Paradesulfitobacterium ferrireducens]|uniref:prephenate dehydratase n=1 Tax=Paradesulfitobacterium ferrireducens TaxID=2816476 RepID=UPI001A900429|nr:prephenate dehydratase [Paradesulfitobacterium ferrireducens]
MPSISYLGPEGSFSEEALLDYLVIRDQAQGQEQPVTWELRPYHSIREVLMACARVETTYSFAPLENSLEGQVGATMDTLKQADNLLIVGEFVHPVSQCLLTSHPLAWNQITRVYSHEQALGQCREFLSTYLPHAKQVPLASTAEAAREVAQAGSNWAAIAPRRAADLYSLHCQARGIQDASANATRFVLVGQDIPPSTGRDKTSLIITTENSPGALFRVLQEFAERKLNLTRIESRPSKQKLGEYIFFIDVEGHISFPPLQEVLQILRDKQLLLKVLGSYPAAKLA